MLVDMMFVCVVDFVRFGSTELVRFVVNYDMYYDVRGYIQDP